MAEGKLPLEANRTARNWCSRTRSDGSFFVEAIGGTV